MEKPDEKPIPRAAFEATRWTLIIGAQTSDSKRSQDALSDLCQIYWYPLYSFVRRKGYSPHDAEDLTQGFFERLLAKDFLRHVDRGKGRFRSFLLASMSHHLTDEYVRSKSQKRGGGQSPISLDQQAAEAKYHLEPADTLTPEHLFEKQWVLTTLESVLHLLREEYEKQGKSMVFDQLKILLTGGKGSVPMAHLASTLNMTEPSTRMAASRLRQRYKEVLRREISHTVANQEDIDTEMQYLFEVLGRR
ncbi:ECF-type sigma factor [bacterium]|nr:ECF-type sigma factor [bacterium]